MCICMYIYVCGERYRRWPAVSCAVSRAALRKTQVRYIYIHL